VIEAVIFDIGETLIDETTIWQSVADACWSAPSRATTSTPTPTRLQSL